MKNAIRKVLNSLCGNDDELQSIQQLGGGSINQVYKVKYRNQFFVIKQNSSTKFPGMFEREAEGLGLLKQYSSFTIPDVIGYTDFENNSFLVLEYIASSAPSNIFFEIFAQQLAQLHQNSSPFFGLHHNNYMGSLQQSNSESKSFYDFFLQERLIKLCSKALEKNLISNKTIRSIERAWESKKEQFEERKPQFIHGDLWSGNYLVNEKGEPCLIDPAVYFGIGELDIAMSKLFGGFDQKFYQVYNEINPPGYEYDEVIELLTLYPLLVHLILFGTSYLAPIEQIVKRYD
ncbi:MAG TPA: fructosamine kinase family protein [Bacteroidia bacterium]|nr:fructosamine kinase family protein [Bacteroidia bacterium]